MNLLAPGYLVAGGAAALVVVALHFLARQRPPAAWLPTARFVPDVPAHAPSRAVRPSDLLVMLLRVAALLLVAFALAGPRAAPRKRRVAHVVLLDRSRAVADFAAARDSARAALGPGDVLIAFDTAARTLPADSLATLVPSRTTGSLSAALVAGTRSAASLKTRADSVAMVLVSPLADDAWDGATRPLRALWPGGVRVVRVAAAAPVQSRVELVGGVGDDPLAASVALVFADAQAPARRMTRPEGRRSDEVAVRVVRSSRVTAADSQVAARGGTLVRWPQIFPASRDTIGAVAARGDRAGAEAVVVSSFPRPVTALTGAAIARWADGTPAATERSLGAGCVRDVAIPLDAGSDVAVRGATRQLVRRLLEPCGGAPITLLADSLVAVLRGTGAPALAAALPAPVGAAASPLAPWLLALAALMLAAEWFVRRRAR